MTAMKHRKGTELAAPESDGVDLATTLEALPGWYTIAAECGACRRQEAVDRWQLARECGRQISERARFCFSPWHGTDGQVDVSKKFQFFIMFADGGLCRSAIFLGYEQEPNGVSPLQ